ncbi:probable disease resistance protein At4g33300 [Juglans regia]|uniref:Probable disease resistance protein At4g33300 n=2 Tax=Juglans regia TaxID=51240 RepID=A0A2I4GRV5_JUGRE|nr:probable disease resistance protein At4g33300 [Juglans regia]
MAVTDLFAGEIATELLKLMVTITKKSCLCKESAEQLISDLQALQPIIHEIKYSGVELPSDRQFQLDRLSETLRGGLELANKIIHSSRWNMYKNFHLAKKMEKLEKNVSRFLQCLVPVHVLADVLHMRFEAAERFDRLEGSTMRLEKQLGSMSIGAGGAWIEEAARKAEEEKKWMEDSLVNLGVGLDLGKKKVKEMVVVRDDLAVVGIFGIGGSGKTTLAREFCKDHQVRSHFRDRILFLTVSQSPNVDQLRVKIWGYIIGNEHLNPNYQISEYNLRYECKVATRTLVVLDDVWSQSVLERLIFPGCKILVVSRFKFPTIIKATYEVELLTQNEAMALFCHSAFGQNSMPLHANENLVKQTVSECKGLPLALKVIGASLRDQSELFWASAVNRLARGEPVSEPHERQLFEHLATSVECLPPKVRECFLDLGSFPEDKKIPLDVLINMWVEIHDIDGIEAFAILVELSNKNLVTLVKDERAGDMDSSCLVFITQHDVLRDLALHLSNRGPINRRRRLLMPRRETELPREWDRNSSQPFDAQIVSVHTGEMEEMDWFSMDFPMAEVLILNFSSNKYFLPPFMDSMPKLRALIIMNYSTSSAILENFSVFSSLANLRSLWLEKVTIPQFSKVPMILKRLWKMSLVLCKVSSSLCQSDVDLPQLFPRLSELTIDHCDDLVELPSSICRMSKLEHLSITNCHGLCQLPADLGKLEKLQILRLYACPTLKMLPHGICELFWLNYLDIAQCVNLSCLPEDIGKLQTLRKIDMSECSQIRSLPNSATSLKSLRHVVCDEEVSWLWRDVEKAMPELHIQVVDKCFNLDWLNE